MGADQAEVASVTESARSYLKSEGPSDNSQQTIQIEQEEASPESLIQTMKQSDGDLVLRFESGLGAHFVFCLDGEAVALYGGPHGIENSPTSIRREPINELFRTCLASLVRVEETELEQSALHLF